MVSEKVKALIGKALLGKNHLRNVTAVNDTLMIDSDLDGNCYLWHKVFMMMSLKTSFAC